MIKVIFGETGAGKTKRIIDIANETLKTANGSIVFIDNDSQYMFGLKCPRSLSSIILLITVITVLVRLAKMAAPPFLHSLFA